MQQSATAALYRMADQLRGSPDPKKHGDAVHHQRAAASAAGIARSWTDLVAMPDHRARIAEDVRRGGA